MSDKTSVCRGFRIRQSTDDKLKFVGQFPRRTDLIEIIHSRDKARLAGKLKRIRERNVALDAELMLQVAAIIQDVRVRGDVALIDYTERFDGCTVQPSDLRFSPEALTNIASGVAADVLDALREAIRRVHFFHEFERQHSWEVATSEGV